MAAPLVQTSLNDAVKGRRSVYQLLDSLPDGVTVDQVKQVIKTALDHAPSAFNSRTTRIVLFLGDDHKQFWDIATDGEVEFIAKDGPERQERTRIRLGGFKAAYGTVFFFESDDKLKEAQKTFASSAELFPEWSNHTSGIHQFAVWAGLEALAPRQLGASLQHYHRNTKAMQQVKDKWDLPQDWSPRSQLVFGAVAPGGWPQEEKPRLPIEQVYREFGAA